VDSNQLINTIYKNAETIRVQARTSTELYDKLQHLNDQNSIAFNSPKDRGIFLSTAMQAERFAIFGFGSVNYKNKKQEN
jgi:3'-phosphoadenosine 5'-phosphosulfate sulfotransferase